MNTVIILLGPTCVGKTRLSLILAKKLKTEIISADSMLVYRHMDIGTAKPSPKELKRVRHHLVNIIQPSEVFSVGIFRKKASEIISDLRRRNKIPLIVGGTGLYIRSLTKGLCEGPEADEVLRAKLREEERCYGSGHLFRKLKTIDPEAASRMRTGDLRRIIRAIEVSLKSERRISTIQKETTIPLNFLFIKIGLKRARKELYALIEERVDTMIERGLIDETRQILKMNPERTALQAIGYKEIQLYLEGAISLDEGVRLIKKRTKLFAKRQMTWFNTEPDIDWIDVTGVKDSREIYEKVVEGVEKLRQLLYGIG